MITGIVTTYKVEEETPVKYTGEGKMYVGGVRRQTLNLTMELDEITGPLALFETEGKICISNEKEESSGKKDKEEIRRKRDRIEQLCWENAKLVQEKEDYEKQIKILLEEKNKLEERIYKLDPPF